MKINLSKTSEICLQETPRNEKISLYSKIKEFFWKPFSSSFFFRAKKETSHSSLLIFFPWFQKKKQDEIYAIFDKLTNFDEISETERDQLGAYIAENVDQEKEIASFNAYIEKNQIDLEDSDHKIFAVIHQLFNFFPTQKKCKPFEPILKKIKKIQESEKTLPIQERLSLREYQVIKDEFTKVFDSYEEFLKKQISMSLDEFLERNRLSLFSQKEKELLHSKISFYQEFIGSYKDYQDFLEESPKKASSYYKPGDIAFAISKRQEVISPQVDFGFATKLKNLFITPYGHVTKFFRNEKNQFKESHVTSKMRENEIDVEDYLENDIYRLNLAKIIQKDKKEFLKELSQEKGISVEEYLQETYEKAENKIQQNAIKNLKSIENSGKGRFKAGLADFLPRGHKRKRKRNDHFQHIHEKFMNERNLQKNPTMICSEYAAKATLAALIEFDQQLEKDLHSYLKQKNSSYKDNIQFPKPKGRLFIHLPFNEKESLRKIHPGRFLKILQKEKCLEKVEPFSDFKKYFQVS